MLQRKTKRIILCVIIILSVLTVHLIHSKEESETLSDVSTSTSYITPTSETVPEPELLTQSSTITRQTFQSENNKTEKLNFKSAVFCNIDTDEILYEHNSQIKISPASLAKILTACVAFKYIDPKTEFTVGTEQSLLKPRSSLSLIKKGHILTLQDLATGMLMASGNDAAYTIAVNVARIVGKQKFSDTDAVQYFCSLMNEFAQNIGMYNSNFTSPDGWDDDKQYTTAEDLLILARYASNVPEISEIVGTKEKYVVFVSGENITWKSTNQMLHKSSKHYNEYAIGMKTGTTKQAGNCLIALFNKDANTYIGIVCGAETSDLRYSEMNRIFYEYTY